MNNEIKDGTQQQLCPLCTEASNTDKDDKETPLQRGHGNSDSQERVAWVHAQEPDITCDVATRRNNFNRVYFTTCAYAAYLSMGILSASIGPSLIDLKEWLNTDRREILLVFTCISAGMLGGTVISGYLIARLSDAFFFLVASLGMTICYIMSVWAQNLAVFCFFMIPMALCMASINCNVQVTVLSLWQHSKHQHSVLQAAHFVWSIGATISPALIEPFLSERNEMEPFSNNSNASSMPAADLVLVANFSGFFNTTYATDSTDQETKIQYGFLAIGVLTLITVALYIAALKMDGWRVMRKKTFKKKLPVERTLKQTRLFKSVMLVGMVLVMFFYNNLEYSSGSLLATFVVDGLKWDKYKGPLITSLFWGVFGVGRFLGIFLSRLLTPIHIIYLDSSLICVGYIILISLINVHEAVTWVAMAIAGLGLGSFAAAGFAFLNMYLVVDGVVSACIIGTFAISSMSMTPLTGLVLDTYGPISVVYVVLASSVIVFTVFLALHLFVSRWSLRLNLNANVNKDRPVAM